MPTVVIPSNCAGPPSIGHGGYVSGLLARHVDGPVQVTLRKPAPLDVELDITETEPGLWSLRNGDDVIASATSTSFELEVPRAPGVEQALLAHAGSPSHRGGHGVHPTCLGCGLRREDDHGLAITVGPTEVDGTAQVAAVWRPNARHVTSDGVVDPLWVLAALDCPGAMAFIVEDIRAGLLGRISFDQHAPVAPDVDYVVSGWQVGQEGRKMFAGTALTSPEGEVLARAAATWFSFS